MSFAGFQLLPSSILLLFQLSCEAEKIELLNTSRQTKQLSCLLPTEGTGQGCDSDSTPMSEPDKSAKC